MIIYSNPDREFDGAGSDATYSAEPSRFTHSTTRKGLEELFENHLDLSKPIHVLDLGCGQGPVLAIVRDMIRQRAPGIQADCRLYGIDISQVAINQCEQRYPDFYWILDSIQEFLRRPETQKEHTGRFQLVINKGGLTHVADEEDYRSTLCHIFDLLEVSGKYLFVKNKKFYRKWCNHVCAGWLEDIFDQAEAIFAPPQICGLRGAYIYIYTKSGPQLSGPPPLAKRKAREITFTLSDGTERRVYVSGDELTEELVAGLVSRPSRDEPYRYTIPTWVKGSARDREDALIVQTGGNFSPGRPRVLIPGQVHLVADGVRFDPWKRTYDALAGHVNCVHDPERVNTMRRSCELLWRWLAYNPDLLVLGIGLQDYRIDVNTGKPNLDLDEFRLRLGWLIDQVGQHAQTKVLWVHVPLMGEFYSGKGRWKHIPDLAEQFMQVAQEVCETRGASVVNLTPCFRRQIKRNCHSGVLSRAVGKLHTRAVSHSGAKALVERILQHAC